MLAIPNRAETIFSLTAAGERGDGIEPRAPQIVTFILFYPREKLPQFLAPIITNFV
jgi:hypothetical protein